MSIFEDIDKCWV